MRGTAPMGDGDGAPLRVPFRRSKEFAEILRLPVQLGGPRPELPSDSKGWFACGVPRSHWLSAERDLVNVPCRAVVAPPGWIAGEGTTRVLFDPCFVLLYFSSE
jgi:hypothetical protein